VGAGRVGAGLLEHDVRDLVAGSPTGVGFAGGQHGRYFVAALRLVFCIAYLRVVGEQVDGLGSRAPVDVMGERVDQVVAGELDAKLLSGSLNSQDLIG
jgi:hypothetical protein